MSLWREEKLEYTFYPDHMEPTDYFTVLLIAELIFINNGHWDKEWPKDKVTIHVNCNDIFAWGCADSEDINYSELQDLYNMWQKDKTFGAAAWCIRKRKQEPQLPVEKRIKEMGIWNLEELLK